MDMEHGRPVYVTPGRYVLRSVRADIAVEPGTNSWLLRSASTANRGELNIQYELIDTRTHEVVLHDSATLQCARNDMTRPAAPDEVQNPEPPSADAVRAQGATQDDGLLDRSSTAPTIESHMAEIRGCYERERRIFP